MAEPSGYRTGLPWSSAKGENGRFGLILLFTVALFLPPALWIPGLELPEPERGESEEVPPRLAKLIERREPPAPVEAPDPKPEPESEPETAADAPAPEPQEPVHQQPAPDPMPKPDRQTVDQAREKASRSGLLAMKGQLATLRSPEPEPDQRLIANVSDSISDRQPGIDDSGETLRGSGGVTSERGPKKQVDVEGHQVREVTVAREPAPEVVAKPKPEPGPEERGMSNIRKVFDAQKTALYSLYRRELRQDPTLEGKVLLELVIEPDGSVSSCDVVSSELDNPELERRIATRVQLFNFGADDVVARKVKFPIDFLPG